MVPLKSRCERCKQCSGVRARAVYICLCEADLGEALLVDMVHHHDFIVVAGWRAPGAAGRDKRGERRRDVLHCVSGRQVDHVESFTFSFSLVLKLSQQLETQIIGSVSNDGPTVFLF